MSGSPLLSADEMLALENAADIASSPPYSQMMRNAGQAAARVIFDRIRRSPRFNPRAPSETRVVILCGKGNNGGDGLVCAKELARLGVTPMIYMLIVNQVRKPSAISDYVRGVYRDLIADGVFIDGVEATGEGRLQRLGELWSLLIRADVVVDALLGTGNSRPVVGDLREMLRDLANVRETLRKDKLPLLIALDGVTGMNFNTGELDPASVAADLTITFHAAKRGHYCFPAAQACGELVVVNTGIDEAALTDKGVQVELPSRVRLADDAMMRELLPTRRSDANKGTHGRPLVIGGCEDFVGAPALSATAAYRVGAGLVTLAVPQSVRPIAATLCREATLLTLHDSDAAFAPQSVDRISDWMRTHNAQSPVLIGPGMGQASGTKAFLARLLECCVRDLKGELVVDADALNILAQGDNWWNALPENAILTPHAAEMARLMGVSVEETQRDRIGHALRFASEWRHVVLLKGAHTVIASPEGEAVVLPFRNPALAVAGTGDVLAGCITGLLAQGMPPFAATVAAAYLHGKAGERWRGTHGDAGMLASDLLDLLPRVLADSRSTS
jgi:ADP-dependent NAD(P)H-hydrate dehydratase / NAD(P)H-hydrate epimerase